MHSLANETDIATPNQVKEFIMTTSILSRLMGSDATATAEAWQAERQRIWDLADEIIGGYCPPFVDPEEESELEYTWDSPAYWIAR